jgi:tetratricopeptide (TPR) repeat protein
MKRTKCLLFLLLPLCFIAGCIQGQASLSLNPDGSGSIKFEGLYDPYSYSENSSDVLQTFQSFIQQIKNTLTESRGIDVWKDVNWRVLDDGRFYFSAEAYFKSLNDAKIYLQGMQIGLNAFYRKDEKQQCFVELKSFNAEPNETATNQEWNQPRRYEIFCQGQEELLRYLRFNIILNLPSKVLKRQGFEEIDAQTVQFLIDGKRMIPLFQFIKAQKQEDFAARWNYDPVKFLSNELLPQWLNDKPLRADFADNGKYFFNYDKQVSDAKKDYSRVMKKLESAADVSPAAKQPEKPKLKKKADNQPNISIDNNDVNARLRSGLALETKDEYAQAIEIYSGIMDDNRADSKALAHAYYRMGMCLFEIGHTDTALEYFEYVLANFSLERTDALRSLKMIQDIRSGTAKRKAGGNLPEKSSIIDTEPYIFVDDVNSALDRITITFSEPMEESSWFYSSFAPGILPPVTGEPAFDLSLTQWILPVKLEPNTVYAIAFNCGDAVKNTKDFKAGFRSFSGKICCKPFVLVFATIDANNMPSEIDESLIKKAEQVNSE